MSSDNKNIKITQIAINRYLNKHKQNVQLKAEDVGEQVIIIGQFIDSSNHKMRGFIILKKSSLETNRNDILDDTIEGFEYDYHRKTAN